MPTGSGSERSNGLIVLTPVFQMPDLLLSFVAGDGMDDFFTACQTA